MDAEVCPSCGASAVADESGDGFSRVCTACGVVLDAAPLQATGFTGDDDGLCFVSSTSRDTMSLRRDERGEARMQRLLGSGVSGSRRICHDWIKQVGVKVNMDSVMVQQACDILDRHLTRKPLNQQMAIAAASCYEVLQNNGRSISLPALAKMAQCTGSHLFQAIRAISESMGKGTRPVMLEDLLPEAAQSIDPSERSQVLSRATALLEPLRRCWFLEGRAPRCIGPALIFVAWKSLNLPQRNISLASFCEMHGLGKPNSSVLAANADLNKVLIQLASQIPWVKGQKLTSRTALAYVPDIVRYSASLVVDAARSAVGAKVVEQAADQRSAAIYATFRKGRKRFSTVDYSGSSDAADCDGNRYISDSEIDVHIRSEREVNGVKAFLKSRKLLEEETAKED
ncbi:transcription factor IIIB 50 kDa subunit isoform X1 [Rhipicephalus microplus]|uniref:transcription factor IIIB 50 kDa subunit isoform X1 n=1 Tax=Rhipicephalus microplus TaxID=6941 RepID=UPI003F6AC463